MTLSQFVRSDLLCDGEEEGQTERISRLHLYFAAKLQPRQTELNPVYNHKGKTLTDLIITDRTAALSPL